MRIRGGTAAFAAAWVALAAGGVAHASSVTPPPLASYRPALPASDGLPAIRVALRGDEVCVHMDPPATGVEEGSLGCVDPDLLDVEAAQLDVRLDDEPQPTAGAVPAGAASVRVAWSRGGTTVVPTEPIPASAGLGPAAQRIRIFRAAPPRSEPRSQDAGPAWVEVLDASGQVIGSATGTQHEGRLVGRPLVRPVSARAHVRLRASVIERLAPSAAQLDRHELEACLELRAPGLTASLAPQSAPLCLPVSALRDAPLVPRAFSVCRHRATGVAALLPAGTSSVTAVGTDGRRRRLTLVPVSPALPGVSVVGTAAPRGVGVRELVVQPGERHVPIGLAPATTGCDGRHGGGLVEAGVGEAREPPAARAPARLAAPPTATSIAGRVVRLGVDDTGQLCVSAAEELLERDCGTLDRAPGATLTARTPVGSRAVVTVLTATAATRARVYGYRGTGQEHLVADRPLVPLDPSVGGAYAGRLRGTTFVVPAGADLEGTGLRGAPDVPAGFAQDPRSTASVGAPNGRPTLAVRRRGTLGGGLVAWTSVVGSGRRADRCVGVTTGARPERSDLRCADDSAPVARIQASCRPRAVVLAAVVRGGGRPQLEVRPTTGAAPHVRQLRLGGGVTAFIARLPARSGVRGLTLTGGQGAGRPRSLSVPPAAQQCGYVTRASLRGGR